MNDKITITEKQMELLRFSNSFRAKQNIEVDIEVQRDIERDELIYRIEKLFPAEKLAEEFYEGHTYFRSPSSTWQMFKQSNWHKWWLKWLVRRRPVRYTQETKKFMVRLDRHFVYPEATIIPKLGRPVIYETTHLIRDTR